MRHTAVPSLQAIVDSGKMLNSTSSVSDAAVTGSDTADTESYVDVNMVDDTTHPHLKRGSYYFENDYVELLVSAVPKHQGGPRGQNVS